jgi:D-alanyl-D-alanine carboxypeptidase
MASRAQVPVLALSFVCCLAACLPAAPAPAKAPTAGAVAPDPALSAAAAAADAAGLPRDLRASLLAAVAADPAAFRAAVAAAEASPDLIAVVDKGQALAADYLPADLVDLPAKADFRLNKAGLRLRAPAAAALAKLAAAARRDGIVLDVSSAYRSYSYQKTVYERNVAEMGQAAADRESARPGHSQHQLGTAVDFGSIDDSFAATAAGRWLAANAAGYGWTLSYPEAMEPVTGYRWESWHYRFIGQAAADFSGRYVGGVQHYALRLLAVLRF